MFTSDLNHDNKVLEAKLRALYALNHKRSVALGFRAPYLSLLQKFGDPQKALPPVIHVAGTNGKGSIVAMLRAMLAAAGYRVHAYTSPHLCRFNERIRLNGALIEDDYLESLIDRAVFLNDGADCTFFEITTAIALTAFVETPADIVLLEVGMGGRLDCTNVIEAPLAAIIGAIGMDHSEYLGETLAAIAGEKAGIIKPHCPTIIGYQTTAAQHGGVMDVFEQTARARAAPLYRAEAEWSCTPHGINDMRFVFGDTNIILPRPVLSGAHQIANAGAALAALTVVKDRLPVSPAPMAQGLKNADWPARLQDITVAAGAAEGWNVWLDGGHNEHAANALAAQAKLWAAQDGKDLHVVLGMLNTKDPVDFIAPLFPFMKTLTLIPIQGEPKSAVPEVVKAALLKQYPDLPLHTAADHESALCQITKTAAQGRVLITGSLYLAGHVLQSLGMCG